MIKRAKKSMPAKAPKAAPMPSKAPAAPIKSSVKSACDCNKLVEDTDALISKTRNMAKASFNASAPKASAQNCCKECSQYRELSKALDT